MNMSLKTFLEDFNYTQLLTGFFAMGYLDLKSLKSDQLQSG